MNFSIKVKNVSAADNIDFETSAILLCLNKPQCHLHFEREVFAENWFDFVEHNFKKYVDVSLTDDASGNIIIGCKNSKLSYSKLIDKFINVRFEVEAQTLILTDSDSTNKLCFYFANRKSLDNYVAKTMKLIERK